MKKTSKKFDVYEMVTNRILEALENGTVPWRKPWVGGTFVGSPVNLKSKKAYRGINVFVLGLQGFSSRYWATFKQAKDLGGSVKKGSKGTPVVFWKWIDKKEIDDDGNEVVADRYPILRYYTVFNLDQIDGIADPDAKDAAPSDFNPIEACEKVVDEMPQRPEIRHNEAQAYYRPDADFVNVPKPELFNVDAEYYSTLFHELTHSTGHADRLNRDGITKLDVPYFACKGYVSASELWRAARRFKVRYRGQRVVVVHLGDHDPSGLDMTRDIFDRQDLFGGRAKVNRIALNFDQVEQYGPPPNPAKVTDSRAAGYIAEYGRSSWELDALEPRVMRDLIADTVKQYRDDDIYQDRLDLEAKYKAILENVRDNWESI